MPLKVAVQYYLMRPMFWLHIFIYFLMFIYIYFVKMFMIGITHVLYGKFK